MLPTLVAEHDFNGCLNTKSCQKLLLRSTNRTDYLHWGTWNLQNRLEKYVFSVYGPALEASFAVMYSIACILHDILKFPQCFRHYFTEKFIPPSEVASHGYRINM